MSEDVKLPFIPAWLDDARLSPNAFRVLCHLWRRRNHKTGKCNPTVFSEDPERATITKVCGMNRNAVHRALKELAERKAATRIRHFKRSSDYQLGVISYCPEIVTIKQENQLSRNRDGNCPETVTNNCPETVTQEGIPSEGHQLEGIPSISSPALPAPVLPAFSPIGDSAKPQITAELIYEAYPKKVAKKDALKAIQRVLKEYDPAKILSATLDYAEAVARWPEGDRRFVPYPAKWYDRGDFNNDPKTWERFPNLTPTADMPVRIGFTNNRRRSSGYSDCGRRNETPAPASRLAQDGPNGWRKSVAYSTSVFAMPDSALYNRDWRGISRECRAEVLAEMNHPADWDENPESRKFAWC